MPEENKMDDQYLLRQPSYKEADRFWTIVLAEGNHEERLGLRNVGNMESITVDLPLETSKKMFSVCKKSDFALFILFQTILKITFSECLGIADITLYCPPFCEKEKTVPGNALLPLTGKMKSGQTFRTVLAATQKQTEKCRKYQDHLLETVYQSLGRQPVRNPEIILYSEALHKFDTEIIDSYSICCSYHIHRSKLSLQLKGKGDRDFLMDLVDNFNAIARLCLHWPHVRIEDIGLYLSDMTKKINLPDRECGNRHFLEIISATAKESPSKIALKTSGSSFTYDDLETVSNKLANYFRADLQLLAGDRVILCMERTERMIFCLLALMKANVVYLPVDILHADSRLPFIEKDARPLYILKEGHTIFRPKTSKCINIDEVWKTIITMGNPRFEYRSIPQNIAYIIYTSGSTGKPKGVQVSEANLSSFVDSLHTAFPWVRTPIMPLIASNAFDIFMFQLLLPLTTKGTVDLFSSTDIMDIGNLVNQLKQVNIMDAVPSLYRQVVDEIINHGSEKDYKHIQSLFIGGDTISDKLLRSMAIAFPKATITVTYGPTEATVFCTAITYQSRDLGQCPAKGNIVGRPMPNTSIFIMDKALKPVEEGSVGEIYISGGGVSQGYLNRPGLTSKQFIDNPLSENDRLYRTGDTARLTEKGMLEFLGRRDRQVKVRGYRIELGEIENTMLLLPEIDEAIATLTVNKEQEKAIAAFFVSKETLETEYVHSHLMECLPTYMIPVFIEQRQRMPLNQNGKIDEKALSVQKRPQAKGVYKGTPSTKQMEQRLLKIWQQILVTEQVGVKDSFFSSGGNSIRIAILINRINEELGLKLPILSAFKYSNVSALSDYILKITKKNLQESTGDIEASTALMKNTIKLINENSHEN